MRDKFAPSEKDLIAYLILPEDTHFIGTQAWEIHVLLFERKKMILLLITHNEIGYFPVGVQLNVVFDSHSLIGDGSDLMLQWTIEKRFILVQEEYVTFWITQRQPYSELDSRDRKELEGNWWAKHELLLLSFVVSFPMPHASEAEQYELRSQ